LREARKKKNPEGGRKTRRGAEWAQKKRRLGKKKRDSLLAIGRKRGGKDTNGGRQERNGVGRRTDKKKPVGRASPYTKPDPSPPRRKKKLWAQDEGKPLGVKHNGGKRRL